jgi:hypothetical protein
MPKSEKDFSGTWENLVAFAKHTQPPVEASHNAARKWNSNRERGMLRSAKSILAAPQEERERIGAQLSTFSEELAGTIRDVFVRADRALYTARRKRETPRRPRFGK